MKIRREFKVGVFAVIVIGISWWGIKWLGGQNLLKTSNIYYAYYDAVPGLMESSRVNMRGVEVGNVRDIELCADRVKVEIAIEKQYADMIPVNSIAELGSAGLMGGMEISIVQGDAAERMADGGVFEGRMKPDMLGTLAEQGGELIDGLNRTVDGVNTLIESNSERITLLVANLESMTSTIDAIMRTSAEDVEGAISNLNSFTMTLAENSDRIESMLANVDTFTEDLAEADFVNQLNTTISTLNGVLSAVEGGEGSVGKLLTDEQLYNSLSSAGENQSLLLEDLKAHPMRYVHFSLFGKSDEQIAAKEAKRAAKAEKRAAKSEAKASK